MSFPLRRQCRICLCDQALFPPGARSQPSRATDKCDCGHPYYNHVPVAPGSAGGCTTTYCGGFYSQATDVNMCLCGAVITEHQTFPATQSVTRVGSDHTFSSNPVTAYRNTVTPPTDRAQPWQPQPPSTLPISQQRVRGSGRGSQRRGRGQSANIPAGPTHYEVALFPWTQNENSQYPSYPSPSYQFTGIRELTGFIRLLETNSLTFSILAPDLTASAWEVLNTSLVAHLMTQKMEILPPDARGPIDNYDNLPWVLLEQKTNRRDNKLTFKPIDVPCYDFVGRLLKDTAIHHPYKINTWLLAISPVLSNVRGPITTWDNGPCADLPHACMPWRAALAADLPWLQLKGKRRRPIDDCFPGLCPTMDNPMEIEEQSPPQMAGSIHARSPSPPLRSLRIRSSSRHRELEVWVRPYLPRYTSEELSDWQNDIHYNVFDDYSLSAKEATQLPGAFTHLVNHLVTGGLAADYIPESGDINCKIESSKALLSPAIRFEVRRDVLAPAASGNGPAALTYQEALSARVKNSPRWNMVGDGTYYTLDLSLSSDYVRSEMLQEYTLDGVLTALLIIHLLIEPLPVSPLLLYAAVCSPTDWCMTNLPLDYLQAWTPDRKTREDISIIHGFEYDNTISPSQYSTHPVAFRSAELLSLPLTYFSVGRTNADNERLKVQLISAMTLGDKIPLEHRAFRAFADGFNLIFLGRDNFITGRKSTSPYLARRFFAALYNNRIDSPGDVFSRVTAFVDSDSRDAQIISGLFLYRLRRWVYGHGHPWELVDNFVDQPTYNASRGDPLCRAQLLLKCLTDLEVLPVTGITTITLNLHYAETSDRLRRAPVRIHTCLLMADITLEEDIINMLLEPGNLNDTRTTHFDLWWHSSLISATRFYNDA